MKQFNIMVPQSLIDALDEMRASCLYSPARSELVRSILTKAVEDWRAGQEEAGKGGAQAR